MPIELLENVHSGTNFTLQLLLTPIVVSTLESREHAAQLGDKAARPRPVEWAAAVGEQQAQSRHAAGPHGVRRMEQQSHLVDNILGGHNTCAVHGYARRPSGPAAPGIQHARPQRPRELLTFTCRSQPRGMHGEGATDRRCDTGCDLPIQLASEKPCAQLRKGGRCVCQGLPQQLFGGRVVRRRFGLSTLCHIGTSFVLS
jgi:hypothetical protein